MGNNLPEKAKASGRNPDFGPLRMEKNSLRHPSRHGGGNLRMVFFRVAVEAGLRWGDMLNAAPNTLVLTIGGLTGFAAKTKTR